MSNSDQFEFHKVCRTCLASGNLKSLYNEHSTQACFDEMLMICTSLNYYENDGLPVQICTDCISELNRAYKFALKCRDTDTKLRSYMQKLVPQIYAIPHRSTASYESTNSLKTPLTVTEIQTDLNQHLDLIKNEIDISIKSEPKDPITDITSPLELNIKEEIDEDLPNNKIEPTQNKAYQCDVCHKRFHLNALLDQHRLLHNETQLVEIPVACIPVISESHLRTITLMRPHEGAVAKREKPYLCKICVKTFSQQHDLTRHMRTHTGEKPYSCTVCGKFFNRKTNLKIHMRTHTEVKQYSCTICNASFNRQQCLLAHLRKHSGEKPYPCTVCDKSFNQSHDLTRHMRTHTGEKPYACNVCNRSFTRKTYLRSHLQKHHQW